MKSFRAWFKGLPGGHRPPTGPLTTAEAAEAEEVRQEESLAKAERTEHEPEDTGQKSDSASA